MREVPVIGVMIGDPAGVGPEVCVRAAASDELSGLCRVVLIGSMAILERAAAACGMAPKLQQVADVTQMPDSGAIAVVDPGEFDASRCRFGEASAASGHAVLRWLRLSEQLGKNGQLQGLVLAPMESASMKATGLVLDMDDLQPAGTFMLRMTGSLRVVPLTEHVPLSRAIELVTPERVLHVIRLADRTLRNWGFAHPRIAVAGINPHAMYEEDQAKIAPAVAQARADGIDVHGPLVCDTVFRHCLEGRHDVVVTMFHDQGQIAVKTVGFEGACTVYIGLPYVMLNVPHGTAYDIAGKGIAQHQSLLSAVRTAALLATGRPLATPEFAGQRI